MNMSEMTDFEMAEFVRSEEENGAEMNRIEEKGVGLRKSVVSIFPPSPIKWHQTQIILASG
ncbi:unnamed protein product [Clavelina lepadiformis]|uniref:Uncharacterized protein n=1 Tax=Clavelina lepadiformis TaxID=159417 RepID=A0ABP0G4M1_CLALP